MAASVLNGDVKKIGVDQADVDRRHNWRTECGTLGTLSSVSVLSVLSVLSVRPVAAACAS